MPSRPMNANLDKINYPQQARLGDKHFVPAEQFKKVFEKYASQFPDSEELMLRKSLLQGNDIGGPNKANWRFKIRSKFESTHGMLAATTTTINYQGVPLNITKHPNQVYRQMADKTLKGIFEDTKEARAADASYAWTLGPVTTLEASYMDFYRGHTSRKEDGTLVHHGRDTTYRKISCGISDQFTKAMCIALIENCPECQPRVTKASVAGKAAASGREANKKRTRDERLATASPTLDDASAPEEQQEQQQQQQQPPSKKARTDRTPLPSGPRPRLQPEQLATPPPSSNAAHVLAHPQPEAATPNAYAQHPFSQHTIAHANWDFMPEYASPPTNCPLTPPGSSGSFDTSMSPFHVDVRFSTHPLGPVLGPSARSLETQQQQQQQQSMSPFALDILSPATPASGHHDDWMATFNTDIALPTMSTALGPATPAPATPAFGPPVRPLWLDIQPTAPVAPPAEVYDSEAAAQIDRIWADVHAGRIDLVTEMTANVLNPNYVWDF